jgi:(2Fe-2S) ferredoxin
MAVYRLHVLVCAGAGCVSSNCKAVEAALQDELKKAGIAEEVKVVETGCIGTCDLGPLIVVYPEGVFYQRLTPDDAREIVNEHFVKGRIVQRLLYRPAEDAEPVALTEEMDFFRRQHRIALRNTGVIDPEVIEEYIARVGYPSRFQRQCGRAGV